MQFMMLDAYILAEQAPWVLVRQKVLRRDPTGRPQGSASGPDQPEDSETAGVASASPGQDQGLLRALNTIREDDK